MEIKPFITNYQNPIRLREALSNIREKECWYLGMETTTDLDYFIKRVNKDEELADTPVTKYINRGSSALAFETTDNKILKLTAGNHFPLNRPHENFDVPVYKKGKIGSMRYYIEEKLVQRDCPDEFVEIIRDMIKEAGYKTYDLYEGDTHQIGLSKEGNLYLLDPECAKYKTILHALCDKIRLFIKNL